MKIDSSIQPRTRRMDGQTDIVTPWAPDGAKNAFISVKMMLSLKECFSENVFTLMKSKSTYVRREKTRKNGLILILHTKISRTHRGTIFTISSASSASFRRLLNFFPLGIFILPTYGFTGLSTQPRTWAWSSCPRGLLCWEIKRVDVSALRKNCL